MKVKYIFLIIGLLFANTAVADEEFDFVSDCIDGFSKLNKATIQFYSTIEISTNPDILNLKIKEYNNELALFSANGLSKYSKSENELIKAVSTNLNNLVTDLVKMNNKCLDFVTNSDYTGRELKKRTKLLIEQNRSTTSALIETSYGICLTLLLPQPDKSVDTQYSALTLSQRDLLNKKLIYEFGESIKKGTKIASKTYFEYISRRIYDYINLEWEFEKD